MPFGQAEVLIITGDNMRGCTQWPGQRRKPAVLYSGHLLQTPGVLLLCGGWLEAYVSQRRPVFFCFTGGWGKLRIVIGCLDGVIVVLKRISQVKCQRHFHSFIVRKNITI